MLELATISLSIFSYVTEENDRIVQALYNVLSPGMHAEKLTKIGTTSQFGDPFTIYSYESDDEEKITAILNHLGDQLDSRSRTYLTENLENKIDFDERSVYLRLDKYKAYQQQLVITEGGDIIKVEIGYNAYTQDENSYDGIAALFRSFHLIE